MSDSQHVHKIGECIPLPASKGFPSGFPEIPDYQWGYPIGGWGGISKGYKLNYNPVIFVHGNTRDASDWDEPERSVKNRFLEAGYSLQELWAISYAGRSEKGKFFPCRTDNNSNVPDLYNFIKAIMDYTGAQKVNMVAHSLGVTVVRRMMFEHPEMYEIVERFVAIAGANHGTSVCKYVEDIFMGCDELHVGSSWLEEINGPDGDLEAKGPAKYMTIYDGTGADIFFVGSSVDSPRLKGADNRKFPGLTHDELRVSDETVLVYLRFIKSHSEPNVKKTKIAI
jgi:pimeloyl-ACP methyl ester carboxylesterase